MTIDWVSDNLKPVGDPEVVFGLVNWIETVRPSRRRGPAQQPAVAEAEDYDLHMRLTAEMHRLMAAQYRDEKVSVNLLSTTYRLTPGAVLRILRGQGIDV